MSLTETEVRIGEASDKPLQSLKRPQRQPIVEIGLGVVAIGGIVAALWMALLYAPTEANQGIAQRIFYMHVPTAWIGMLSFAVLAISGMCFLITRKEHWDLLARAAAATGAVFITLALITGAIWGKAVWGTWWAWEPKLTATLLLWFIYIAYLLLRNYMGRSNTSAYSGAVLGIIGIVDLPIIYLAAEWWRTLHPTRQVGADEALPVAVRLTLLVATISFTLLYVVLVMQAYQLERLQARAYQLRTLLEYE